ncbi:unnamed protein product [Heterobilharzia americana]|nr:unnamed protein product [Heterobilharzia americana]
MECERLPEGVVISEQLIQTSKFLQSFRDKSLFTDVILCAGEEELPCHKAVLAASSAYFFAMFSSPYKEQQTSRVTLDYISPWALRRLLDFVYLGILEITEATVQDVFLAASLLDYPVAVKACVEFMKSHLDITNCLGIEALAEMHNLTDLAQSSHKLAVENFSSLLLESNEWVTLPISTVISYISSDELDVPSEQFVWDACINWIDQVPETRIVYLPQLLSHIRLKYLDKEMLEIQLQENPLIIECKNAQNILKYFLHEDVSKSDDTTGAFINTLPPRPATLKRPTLVVLGGLNTCILNCMQSFSPSRTVWQTCPSMPVDSLAWFSVAVIANTLFVIGGIKAGTLMDTVYAYSPVRSSWSQRKCMLQARARHSSVSVGSRYIFVFGGVTMSTNSSHQQPSTNRVIMNEFQEMNFFTNRLNHNSSYLSPYNPNLPVTELDIPTLKFEKTIIRYDICSDTWITVGETDNPRLESHVVLVNDSNDNTSSTLQSSDILYETDADQQNSLLSDLSDAAISENIANQSSQIIKTHKRNNSANMNMERVFVEIGGITELQPHGTDQVAFYRLRSDYTIFCTADYIKLPQQFRYVNCCVHPDSNLLYIFWESTSELSVLDLRRHTLRPLAPLISSSTISANEARVHAGLTWIGEFLYVVGGFSEFVGDDRRPTAPRDDIHCYDPTSNTWSLIKVLNTTVPRAIFGCVCLNM